MDIHFLMFCSMHSKLCFPRVQYEACTFPVTVLGIIDVLYYIYIKSNGDYKLAGVYYMVITPVGNTKTCSNSFSMKQQYHVLFISIM